MTDVLSEQALNRALLARQHLLERATAPLPRVLERIGGIQAQYAPAMYIGLWSRVAGFERDRLTRALERRSVVQGTLLRATIHLVSAADYWAWTVAVRDGRREWWIKAHRGRVDPRAVAAATRRLRRQLAKGAMRAKEVEELIGREAALGVGIFLDIVRVPPSGTWERRRADIYAAAEDWLGAAPDIARDDAVALLVRRYLAGFGPAPKQDIANWAGLSAADVGRALERLELRRFRDERGKELVDLPRAPLPHAETPAPVRFLPVWDATLLVHARRTGILPEPYRPRVFHVRTPHSVNTFLVDGRVAGTWRYEEGRIAVQPFRRLARAERAELDAEAERLAAFHA